MSAQDLDVIIPVYERPEAAVAVFSLLAAAPRIRQILLVDSSQTGDHAGHLTLLARRDGRVSALHHPLQIFSKSRCLNAGIRASQAELVLVSDADIFWLPETIHQMVATVAYDHVICHVANVQETDVDAIALRRAGYGFRIDVSHDARRLEVVRRDLNQGASRPGCGLILASRKSWHHLGGFSEDCVGWGWEDQDLLIRASLMRFSVAKLGRVLHMSHSDSLRNASLGNVDPASTRNANILRSVARIRSGKLHGDLNHMRTHDGTKSSELVPIEIRFEPGIEAELMRR
jgi:GT2 family glycosyltransferase